MFCREQAAGFRSRKADFEAAGARLAYIGSGGPHFAPGFVEDYDLARIPLLSDEKLPTSRLFDFRRGLGTLLVPGTLVHGARALGRGFMQGRTQGDALQQGGVAVVRPGGALAWLYRSREAGDHPPVDEVLAAVRAAG